MGHKAPLFGPNDRVLQPDYNTCTHPDKTKQNSAGGGGEGVRRNGILKMG